MPDLKLLMTSGMRNASIDLDYAAERGITVCGTEAAGQPTAELAIGIMLELARKIGYENARMKPGVPWQSTLGIELGGKTLGLLGFGKLGSKVGEIGKAIGMNLIAWSQNLTAEKAKAGGADAGVEGGPVPAVGFPEHPPRSSATRSRGLVDRQGSRADEADRVHHQHVARADHRRALADVGARISARSRARASTRSMSSRCRSATRCASSTMSC